MDRNDLVKRKDRLITNCSPTNDENKENSPKPRPHKSTPTVKHGIHTNKRNENKHTTKHGIRSKKCPNKQKSKPPVYNRNSEQFHYQQENALHVLKHLLDNVAEAIVMAEHNGFAGAAIEFCETHEFYTKMMYEINTALHTKALDIIDKKIEKEYEKFAITHNRAIDNL